MKFNGVNNQERQRYLVVSGVVICACVGIPCAPRLRRIGVCFERELPALFCVAAHRPSSFSPPLHSFFPLFIQCDGCLFPFPAWGFMAGLPGFASHGSSLHLGAGCQ